MKKEVFKKLIREKLNKIQKQKEDELKSKGYWEKIYLRVNGYNPQTPTAKDYQEALIEVLAELL